jgi:hypothetical protein
MKLAGHFMIVLAALTVLVNMMPAQQDPQLGKDGLDQVVAAMSLASFDAASSSWIADPGVYTVKLGASSKYIRQTATSSLDKELMVKKESTALAPEQPVSEIKPKPWSQRGKHGICSPRIFVFSPLPTSRAQSEGQDALQ